jgi:hypothetical protein
MERGSVVNIGSMDMLGYELITADKFLPISSFGEPGGPMMLVDIFSQVTEDIRKAAHYTGIKPTTRMLEDLVNDEDFVMAVQDAGKTRHLTRFRQQIEAMNKEKYKANDALSKIITRVGANRARSILANGRIAMLQAGSYQLYANEATVRYMRGGFAPKEIYDNWDFYQYRANGMGSIHSVVSQHQIRKMHLGRGSMLDIALLPMHKVDLKVLRQAATIAWHEMTDETLVGKSRRYWEGMEINPHDLEVMSPEFMKALHDRATYLASATQPMFFPESRNFYSTTDNAFLRELARFRSFTDMLLRNNSRQIALWQMGEIGAREAMTSVGMNHVFAAIWYNGLRFALDQIMKDEEDEKAVKDVLIDVLLTPISLLPFIGWTLKTGITWIGQDSGYGPANFGTLTADQLNHVTKTAFTLGKAMYIYNSGDPGSKKRAEKMFKGATRDAVEDMLIMMWGLPPWLVDIVPEDKKKKKGKKSSGITVY